MSDDEIDDALTAQARQLMPLAGLLGLEILRAQPNEVRARLEWRPELCTAGGLMHGGALMALADSIGAMVAFSHLPEGAAGTATLSSATNFLGPARGTVVATARLLHRGRTTIVVETEVADSEGRRVAKVTQTQMVLSPR
jgi:uncharacterized protein (TIGR00369 family)